MDRDENLMVRLDADEKATIEAAAKAAGLTVSGWVRSTLLAAARKVSRGRKA